MRWIDYWLIFCVVAGVPMLWWSIKMARKCDPKVPAPWPQFFMFISTMYFLMPPFFAVLSYWMGWLG